METPAGNARETAPTEVREAVRPDYEGACVSGIVPALLNRRGEPWLPDACMEAETVVLLVLDGLGWNATREHRAVLPVSAALEGGPITTVLPSTTTTALTSITTGLPPAAHGLLGYTMRTGPDVLNLLRWTLVTGGAPPDPARLQPQPAFLGRPVPTVTRSEFLERGFSKAHLRGARLFGWRAVSTLIEVCRRKAEAREPFVYAYYDGVDIVAHARGLGDPNYVRELSFADRLVGELLDALPEHATLLVTADHGQVDLDRARWLSLDAVAHTIQAYAGDGRFRSLYARAGAAEDLRAGVEELYGARAWVFSRERLLDEGWLGPERPSATVAARVGDVVIAARDAVAFADPGNTVELGLRSGHGSMTPDEMLVPLLAARGRAGAAARSRARA